MAEGEIGLGRLCEDGQRVSEGETGEDRKRKRGKNGACELGSLFSAEAAIEL